MKSVILLVAAAGLAASASADVRSPQNPILRHQNGTEVWTVPPGGGDREGDVNLVQVGGPSFDGQGSANNYVLNVNLGAGIQMNGIGWDVSLFADPNVGPFGGSWLSEINAVFGSTSNPNQVFLNFSGTNTPGQEVSTSPVLKFDQFGIPNIVLDGDGLLRIEIFESFDDAVNVADGSINGAFLVQTVPAPGAAALLGLSGVACLRRRRR